MTGLSSPIVSGFFGEQTFTISYLVRSPSANHAIVIDPVLDFDASAGRTTTGSADRILDVIRQDGLVVPWIIETHAHADHLSAAPYLKENLGAQIAIGTHIKEVQSTFRDIFNLTHDFPTDGRQFDASSPMAIHLTSVHLRLFRFTRRVTLPLV